MNDMRNKRLEAEGTRRKVRGVCVVYIMLRVNTFVG